MGNYKNGELNSKKYLFDTIRYWRTQGGSEVNFIVNSLPIEVKYSTFKSPKIQRSLKHYIEQYKPGNVIVVTRDFAGETNAGETIVTFVPVYLLPWIERLQGSPF